MKHVNLVKKISVEQAKLKFAVIILGEDASLIDFLSEEERDEYIENILELINTMEENEQVVLKKRFGLEDGEYLTCKECGRILNLTSVRISQIETKAIRKLRHIMMEKDKIEENQHDKFLKEYSQTSIRDLPVTIFQQNILNHNRIYSIADLLNYYLTFGDLNLHYLVGADGGKTIISKLKKLKNFDKIKDAFNKKINDKIKNQNLSGVMLGGFDLSVRAHNALRRHGLLTLQDVVDLYNAKGINGFLEIRCLGKETLKEVISLIESYTEVQICDKEM